MRQDQTAPNLHDLPLELLDHIMFFLPLSSIPRLMVNRKLRPVCEQYLYRRIRLVVHPYRSLRLLNTLAHRPDLALLIRDLHINLERCQPEVITKFPLPDILQPDGLAPLSSTRNIRSLHIGGMKWLSDPSLAKIRRVVSRMELASLVITDSHRVRPNNDEELNQRVSRLRAILRSQPQLEFLYLMRYAVKTAMLSSIKVADVPNLRRFKGNASYAGHFLNTAPKLSKLDLDFGFSGLAYKSLDAGWSGHRVQELTISLPPCLRALPLLRKLEIRNLNITNTEDLDQTVEVLLKFKKYCPILERLIDTKNWQWVYVPSADEGSGFRAKLDRQLESKSLSYRFDLAPPEWDA
ncbi:hypothetical protein FS837_007596 [Tulasnella sp. UAMH 9824]|nr:hypothetical protein FS837_007596 [Tulasnella sp. UAMH 9824]